MAGKKPPKKKAYGKAGKSPPPRPSHATSRAHASQAPASASAEDAAKDEKREKARLAREQRQQARLAAVQAAVLGAVRAKTTGGGGEVPTPGPESTVDQRIDHCFALMSRGLWQNYATRVQLSAAWGVVDSTIRDYAAEASRRLKLDPVDVESAKLQHARFCEAVQEQALATLNQITGMPDFGAALKANELSARYRGIDVDGTRKVEVTGKDGGPIEAKGPVIMLPPEIEE